MTRTELADPKLLKRHRELVAIIDSNLEEFAKTGIALAAIRDEETYKAEEFENFNAFLKAQTRWAINARYAYRLIKAAIYRQALPPIAEFVADRPQGRIPEWNEWQIRELTRLPTPKDATRVATKVLKEIASNGDVQLSATVLRKRVDADLGVKRGHAAAKDKPKQMDFAAWWRRASAILRECSQGFNGVGLKDWRGYVRDHQTAAEDLAQAIDEFQEAAQRVRPELPKV